MRAGWSGKPRGTVGKYGRVAGRFTGRFTGRSGRSFETVPSGGRCVPSLRKSRRADCSGRLFRLSLQAVAAHHDIRRT